jgi:serine/threonine protein phosphatase PrpC
MASSHMNDSQHASPAASLAAGRPRDEELDLFGVTHPGRVRTSNQDQFILCTVHPQVVVHGTSLADPDAITLRGERLATIMLVADGVGGSADGSQASRLATVAMTEYFASAMRCWHSAGSSSEEEFTASLREAAHEAHRRVRAEAATHMEGRNMATTLSVGIVVWPWLYVVQVGDGALRQVTRDQTLAQEMIDRGAMTPERAHSSPLQHVLSSAIGADEALPEITRVDISRRGSITLVCSDGLTKHVSDAEIAAACETIVNAEQLCRSLVDLALERGGSDNVTVVVGRALEQTAHR